MKRPKPEEMIEALTEARDELKSWGPLGLGICGRLSYFNPATEYLQRYITHQLGNRSCYLDEWLKEYRPELKVDKVSMQKYRLQWIRWMIKGLQDEIKQRKKQ